MRLGIEKSRNLMTVRLAQTIGIETIAKLATEINASIENIGARRLHTIIERVLDEISFTATDRGGEKIIIDKDYVTKNLGELAKDTDLSKFIL